MTRRVLEVRNWPRSAAPRCAAYALCSDLLTSPHEFALQPLPDDRRNALQSFVAAQSLLDLATDFAATDRDSLKAEYSGLFEVGDEGPPVPIRESLRRERSVAQREEVVRFYAHFGGDIETNHAWQPDHAAIELEFMHLLCHRELHADDANDALTFQLAQLDFSARHLDAWLPALAQDVHEARPDGRYARITRAVADFVAADLSWQRANVSEAADAARPLP